ncbi:MAG: Uncharacterized protein XD63_1689 [Thermoanaerobacterales bacterium 50_218]|nr:MAG: Uncharacterized protein XD63_1689 [Thermoanaerobacterales bacterium 50_218]HAA90696.1 hypothetical protein [Peptococcaceae bacterium]
MREVNISLGPSISNDDLEVVRTAVTHLRQGDQLTLTVEAADAHETDLVLRLLREAGLDYQAHGSHSGLSYYIIAKKKE